MAVLSCALLFGAPGTAAARSSNPSVVPADGRLNTANYTATVTSVAWPATNDGREPTPGRRFVRFTLEVTAAGQSVSPTSPAPTLAAALRWDATSHPLSVSSLDDELQGASGSSASASYVASVPSDTHDVDLVLSQGSFSQSLDLWTLRRVPPAPAVLYRDPSQTTLSATAPGPTTLSLSNPADGFTSDGHAHPAERDPRLLRPVGHDAVAQPRPSGALGRARRRVPRRPGRPGGLGPLPGLDDAVAGRPAHLHPLGASAVPATLSDAGDTTGKGNSDDGLFDATYSFLVPATLSTGTLEVAAGSFTGAEFTLYTAESGTTTLEVSAPASLALSFPRTGDRGRPAHPAVGRPARSADRRCVERGLAGAGRARAARMASRSGRRSSSCSSLPPGSHSSSAGGDPATSRPLPPVPMPRCRCTRPGAEPRATSSRSGRAAGPGRGSPGSRRHLGRHLGHVRAAAAAPNPVAAAFGGRCPRRPRRQTKAVNFVGPRRFVGFSENSSRILEATLTYLLCHDAHHLSADQIALGMWPYGRSRGEATRKTIQNNASALRNWIGAEHLPDAAVAGGYLIEGIDTDWASIERLSREAQTVGAEAARALRSEALELVRGLPFEGLSGDGYDWIEYEDLRQHRHGEHRPMRPRPGPRPLRGRRLQRRRSCGPRRPARRALRVRPLGAGRPGHRRPGRPPGARGLVAGRRP